MSLSLLPNLLNVWQLYSMLGQANEDLFSSATLQCQSLFNGVSVSKKIN
jgi:hypothetical protein